jgi:tetratricopeptide (TPR) repeat protein
MNEDSASTTVDPVPGRQPVVSGPIDRLGLANNLYAVGEYPTAMELYMESDEAPLTAQQQIWAEYQTANCLRRLGRTSEASNRYRRLAGQPEAGWLSEKANWWVGVLEQIRQLEKSLEEVPETSTAPAPVGVLGPAIPEEVQEPIQP